VNPFESNVSDADIEREFAGKNYGNRDHRKHLEQCVLGRLAGYHVGHTSTQIMKNLGLISSIELVTKKGKRFLFAAFYDQRHG